MNIQFCFALLLALLSACSPFALGTVGSGENALKQGAFEDPSAWLELNDDNLKIVAGGPDGMKALSFETKTDRMGCAKTYLDVDPSWKVVSVSARFFVSRLTRGSQPWENVRVSMRALNADGKEVGYGPTPEVSEVTDGWVTITATGAVPENTARFEVQPGIFAPEGSGMIADVQIIPNPPLPHVVWTKDFPEGRFDPAGLNAWTLTGDARARVLTEEKQTFLRIENPDANGDVACMLRVKIDPKWSTVTVRFKTRASNIKPGPEGWNEARMHLTFEDEKGDRVGPWPATSGLKADSAWTELEATNVIPAGAIYLRLEPAMFRATGTFDVADIRLIPQVRGELPAGMRSGWGEEPLEQLSPTRAVICLNGLWRFQPADGPRAAAPDGDWGFIRVPGSWQPLDRFPGVVAQGMWTRDIDLATLERAWYQRPIVVPPEWKGRAIHLNLRRVSTDAAVLLDGVEVGRVEWPAGTVDLTPAVKFGVEQTLAIKVVSTPEAGDVVVLMGTADTQVTRRAARLESRGIIDDVLLSSRPAGTTISNVALRTSVREKSLALEVELEKVSAAGNLSFDIEVLDGTGKTARTFRAEAPVRQADVQSVNVSWSWPDPKLWDSNSPHLYTLRLRVHGAGVDDAITQRFGFREFWIEGRRFLLNGTEVRLRPNMLDDQWGWAAPTREGAAALIDGQIHAGFNFGEMWPWDHDERGTIHSRRLLAEVADEKGFLISGNVLNMARYLRTPSWDLQWYNPGVRERYEQRMSRELREYLNHPSIVMWGSTANYFGNEQDSAPQRLGRLDYIQGESRAQSVRAGREAIAIIKKHDPTRPVFTHHGSYVGDVHTNNMYLNFLPLQDRTEWLSAWTVSGELPFMAVEFGTPLHSTFMRARDGFTSSVHCEPWMTEFSAIYLGRRAYELERDDYRGEISRKFLQDQTYTNWQLNAPLENAPALQEIQRLFTTHTWRAWRTWGLTGGLVPWSRGHGYELNPPALPPTKLPPFQPGRRGPWIETVESKWMNYLRAPDWKILPGGEALVANNGPTLAWIAGPAQTFTDRTHSYASGATVSKQAIVINDLREQAEWSLEWTAVAGDQTLASGRANGTIQPATDVRTPIEFDLPRVDAKRDVTIQLSARIGNEQHTDAFQLRVFPDPSPVKLTVSIYDPKGLSTAMLTRIGIEVRPWDGAQTGLLVIGREAQPLPESLEDHIRAGGRVLMMSPSRQTLADRMGLRVANPISRNVYAVDPSHPVMAGLDDEDLRDWAGESTMLPPVHPDFERDPAAAADNDMPKYGWRWGTRHGVSSAMIEKPHRSGARPILEGEFDLQYTPLLEVDIGRGRLTLCTLDLEDQAAHDPAADQLLRNLLNHAATAPLADRVPVMLVGTDAAAGLLDEVGVEYTRLASIPAQPNGAVLVLDPRAGVPDETLKAFLNTGGKALVLATGDASTTLGLQRTMGSLPVGNVTVPAWPQAVGLSPSDLRARVPAPAVLFDPTLPQVVAGGLLARVQHGDGMAVLTQIDPAALDADQRTYLRFTRWRQTRAIAQVLANLGASFPADRQFLVPPPAIAEPTLPLAGQWRAIQTSRIPDPTGTGRSPHEPMTELALEMVRADADLSTWKTFRYPSMLEPIGGEFSSANGESVVATNFDLPHDLAERSLTLSLGQIDDFDDVYINGTRIGGSPADRSQEQSQWNVERHYIVPPGLLKPGMNRIAIRIWDHFGEGGSRATDAEIRLFDATYTPPPGYYHPDYRPDFKLGDDPYRYYRW